MSKRSWFSGLFRLDSRSRKRRWRKFNHRKIHRRLFGEPLEPRQMLTTFLVDSLGDNTTVDGVVTLREAIDAANTNTAVGDAPAGMAGLDTINFDGSLGGTININASLGEFPITDNLTINGPGASVITVDAGGTSRIFNVDDGVFANAIDVEISGLTLTGGNATGTGAGGAIRSINENLTVRDAVVTGNTASSSGGGILISNVSATSLIEDSTISGNVGAPGGGVAAVVQFGSGSVTIRGTTISGNQATTGGGLFLVSQFSSATGAVTVENSTISANQAGTGGGLSKGGGIEIRISNSPSNSVVIRNSTIAENTAQAGFFASGGGIYQNSNVSGGLLLENTIAAENSVQALFVGEGPDVYTDNQVLSAEFSLIGDNADSGLTEAPVGSPDANGNLIGGATNGVIDPLLGLLQNNGGPTETHELLTGSPAIDVGDPAFVAPPVFDQRGPGFDRVSHGRLDMGAFEVQNRLPDPPVDVDPAPNMVDEGAATGTPVGITAQATDPDGDTVTYSLTDDAGGRFQINSITGVVTVADGTLLDGPNVQTITVQADDGISGTSSSDFEIIVKNVDPTITSLGTDATLADKALPDETVTVDGSFFDPGVPDTHTATVDWGDGSPVELLTVDQIANTFTGDHEYTTGGIFTITVLVSDDEGAFDVETTTAVVTGVGLVDGTLYVIGTDGKDDVDIKLGSDGGSDGGSDEPQLKVKAKLDKGSDGGSDGGTDFFDVADVDRIVIQLCGGDDKAKIHKDVDIDAEIHGGDGKDKLTGGGGDDFLLGENGKDDLNGGRGNDIVSGGDGDDKLRGGSDGGSDDGFDILIGGFGKDDLKGGKGDDILIGGLVTLDMAMLNDVRDIWTDGSSYSTRVAALTDPGGLLEANVTVLDDAAKDRLKGDKGRDLFFAKLDGSDKDKVKDLKGDEDLFVLF